MNKQHFRLGTGTGVLGAGTSGPNAQAQATP